MITLTPTQQALVDGEYQMASWLFTIDTVASGTYYWSTAKYSHDAAYKAMINPKSFNGITIKRGRSEYGIHAPSETTFSVVNKDSLPASYFTGASVTVRLVIDNGSTYSQIRAWKFNVSSCVDLYGELRFKCIDFVAAYMVGSWPKGKLVSHLYPEQQIASDDGYCVPVVYGTAYIPLRSVYTAGSRYYLLGEAGTYTISEVSTPRSWGGKSVWLSADYTFPQSIDVADGDNYQLFQPIIADSDNDGTADASGFWQPNNQFLDMPTKFSFSGTASMTSPANVVQNFLESCGLPTAQIDPTSITSSATTYATWGLSWSGAFVKQQPRQKVLAEMLVQCHSVLDVEETVKLRVLSKTSKFTINASHVKDFTISTIKPSISDSGSAFYQDATEPADVLQEVIIPAKATKATPDAGSAYTMTLVHDSAQVQKLGSLAIQKKLLVKGTNSFTALPALLALQPDDMVTINHANYGGTYPALVDQMSIKPNLLIDFQVVTFSDTLDDFTDLTFSAITTGTDTTTQPFPNADVTDYNIIALAITEIADSVAANFVTSTLHESDIATLQNQVDGNYTSWFYDDDPTLLNAPAVDWTTDALKDAHILDLYYASTSGKSFRFVLNGTTYEWIELADSALTAALALAQTAQDTADSKRRVFVTTPVTPYDVGDLWSTTTELKRAIVAKTETEAYAAGDWSEIADITAENTAGDTTLVNGVAAATVQSNSLAAYNNAVAMESDTVFSIPEKEWWQIQWPALLSNYDQILAQATTYTIQAETVFTAYTTSKAALFTFLDTTHSVFATSPAASNFTAGALSTLVEDYYAKMQIAINRLGEYIENGTLNVAQLVDAVVGDISEITPFTDGNVGGPSSYTKVKEWRVGRAGTYRVKCTIYVGIYAGTIYYKIYKNGTPHGAEQSTSGQLAISQDLTFSSGDLLQIYVYVDTAGEYIGISNFKICSGNPVVIGETI